MAEMVDTDRSGVVAVVGMERENTFGIRLVLVAVAAAMLLLAGCGSDDDRTANDDTASVDDGAVDSETGETEGALAADDTEPGSGDFAEFCENAPGPGEEVPQEYVGSDEHVADLRALRDQAPEEVVDDLDLIIGYFEDSVDPSDPESQMSDTFPDEVDDATGRMVAFILENCS